MSRHIGHIAIALLVGFTSLGTAKAAEPAGIKALTAKKSPLSKGEVIAFFGDSITQAGAGKNGYCRLIAAAIAKQRPELGIKIVYAGISGHKVPNLQARLVRDVLSKKPTIVFIYIGINDVWHSIQGRGTSKKRFDSGLRDLIKKIRASGAKIVLCTPSTIGEKTDGSNKLDPMLKQYSAISRKVASDTGTTLCDLRKAFLTHLKKHNPGNKRRGILTSDGVHRNKAGNKFVAAQAAQAIAKALRKKSAAGATRLFNGKDLAGWRIDAPRLDKNPAGKKPFIVRGGLLVSLGIPAGHLITTAKYENYRLRVEYRFAAKPGNCGVLVHASKPRALYKMFPKSIEVQMNHRHAGDFWCIAEDITVPNMVKRRGPKKNWGVTEGKGRRILNLTDGSENSPGKWNSMVIECLKDAVKVWVNGDLVNHGTKCTATKGRIALQAEGSEVEFRTLLIQPISKLSQ